MMFESRALDERYDVHLFDCGVESLNSWLQNEALRAERSDTARTYVWTETVDSTEVLAYFSIAPTAVQREMLSRSQAANYSFDIPSYLLARLALDKRLKGQGLGSQLLVDAIGRIVGSAEVSGGRLIVVDAVDDNAAAFYRRHDFVPVRGNTRRLVLKIATARALMVSGPQD
jgi:GNAT superfamily N-acetyltransferase